jgi:hypothetical protein
MYFHFLAVMALAVQCQVLQWQAVQMHRQAMGMAVARSCNAMLDIAPYLPLSLTGQTRHRQGGVKIRRNASSTGGVSTTSPDAKHDYMTKMLSYMTKMVSSTGEGCQVRVIDRGGVSTTRRGRWEERLNAKKKKGKRRPLEALRGATSQKANVGLLPAFPSDKGFARLLSLCKTKLVMHINAWTPIHMIAWGQPRVGWTFWLKANEVFALENQFSKKRNLHFHFIQN